VTTAATTTPKPANKATHTVRALSFVIANCNSRSNDRMRDGARGQGAQNVR
jgi:hypothetical protein